MITTKGMSVPEALRTIAGWIEEGHAIECTAPTGSWVPKTHHNFNLDAFIYRAKPVKPRVGTLGIEEIDDNCWLTLNPAVKGIELTDEVRERCADLLEDV